MTIQYINTGTSPNSGDGDSLRSAFTKVNSNFEYLSTASFSGGGTGSVGPQGPQGPAGSNGELGPTGPQGDVGPTGPAGEGIVQRGDDTRIAYYSGTGTVLTAATSMRYIKGTTSTFPQIQFGGDDLSGPLISFTRNVYTSQIASFNFTQHHENPDSNNFTYYRSRGTSANPTNVQNGDDIIDIVFAGHNTSFAAGAALSVVVEGTPTTPGQVPARIELITNNGGSLAIGAALSSTSTWKINKLSHLSATTSSIRVATNLVPDRDSIFSLGSTSSQWRSLYVSSSTIYINRVPLTINENNILLVNGSQVVGTVGPQGPQGVVGPTGPQGIRGADGDPGAVGPTGPQGNTGISGPAGPRGSDGDPGAVGPQGPQGDAGPRGLQGDQGVSIVLLGTVTNSLSLPLSANFGEGYIAVDTGRVWFWGTNTAWNDVGQIVGPKGDIGDTGPAGATGDPGSVGPTGPQGDPGQQGDPGPAGATGDPGAVGPTGPQGDPGQQGDPGPAGATGDPGAVGPTGPQGDPGQQGDVGPTGPQGERAQEDRLTTGSYSVILGADGIITLPNTMTIDGSGTGGENVQIGGTSTWISVNNDGAPPGFYVTTDAGGAYHQWEFGTDGTTTFPSNTIKLGFGADLSIATSGAIGQINATSVTVVSSGTNYLGNSTYATDYPGTLVFIPSGPGPLVGGNFVVQSTEIFTVGDIITIPASIQNNTTATLQVTSTLPYSWSFATTGQLNLPRASNGNARIQSADDIDILSENSLWTFGTDGTLTAPGHLLPDADLAYDLGSTSSQWRSIYVGTGTIFIGGVALGVNQDNYVTVDGNPIITINTAGNLTIQGDVNIGTVTVSDTAPVTTTGTQWFNTIDGRTYVAYNGQWLDASPAVVPTPETYLDEITIDGSTMNINGATLTINTAGTLLVNGSEVTGSGSGGDRLINGDYQVILDQDGVLNLPRRGAIRNLSGTYDVNVVGAGEDGFAQLQWTTLAGAAEDDPNGTNELKHWLYIEEPGVFIETNVNGEGDSYEWKFGTDGSLEFPEGAAISSVMGVFRLTPPAASTDTQALLIYPTGSIDGDHIHLTAGGGTTDLYLGNDDQFVKIDHSGTVVVQTYSTGTTSTWTFGTDGTLTFPSGNMIIGNAFGGDGIVGSTNTTVGVIAQGQYGAVSLQWVENIENIGSTSTTHLASVMVNSPLASTTGTVQIVTGVISTSTIAEHTWEFGADGVLTLSTASTILGAGTDPNVYIETASTSTAINTWTFAADGGLTLPNGATIVDTTTTLVLTPNSPAQVTSLVLRSTYNSYMTADYPTDQGYQQYLHELDPVTYPDPYVSTGTEGTVISITLWDASGLQYVQGDVEYIITGTGITAADFTPAVLTGTFAAANWTLDGGGFNYTNTNMLMIANDAIVEGEETFTITIITTGTYAPGAGSNYLRVNIADGNTEGSESGHIHLISENMAQTSIFLGNDDKYVKVAADDQIYINVPNADTSGTSQLWTFGNTGTLTFPDSTVQTTAYKSSSGSWTLATGSNTVSITVPTNGNYTMWVNGNIPNGIVNWNATVNVSNTNVPAIGSQYAWYYALGNALVLTAIPDQIVGTVGVISTSNSYVGNTANVFTFGITNNSTSTQVIAWGYTTL